MAVLHEFVELWSAERLGKAISLYEQTHRRGGNPKTLFYQLNFYKRELSSGNDDRVLDAVAKAASQGKEAESLIVKMIAVVGTRGIAVERVLSAAEAALRNRANPTAAVERLYNK